MTTLLTGVRRAERSLELLKQSQRLYLRHGNKLEPILQFEWTVCLENLAADCREAGCSEHDIVTAIATANPT